HPTSNFGLTKKKKPNISGRAGFPPRPSSMGFYFFKQALSSSEDALTKVTAEEPESVPIGSTQP
ncbi:MAG: hypothetical protein AAF327_23290, partial [Cyanobacteria bacterium P01_A01_bin.37]